MIAIPYLKYILLHIVTHLCFPKKDRCSSLLLILFPADVDYIVLRQTPRKSSAHGLLGRMFLKHLDLTTALRPSYLPDEVNLFVQENVGLYEG